MYTPKTHPLGRPPKHIYDPGPLGYEVRKYRESRGWSQTELARVAGLTQSELTRIERGARKTASLRFVYLLARAFATHPHSSDPVAGYPGWMGHLSELLMAGLAAQARADEAG